MSVKRNALGRGLDSLISMDDTPARGSSAVEGHTAAGLTDENCKTYWLASSNDETQWVEIDLQAPATVNAIQVNYNDY